MPKLGYKFTPEQQEHIRLGHLGQVAWNKGTGGCKRGHSPSLYVSMPSGVYVCLGCKRENGAKYRTGNKDRILLKNRIGRYSLSLNEFQDLWTRQSACCAICGTSLLGIKYRIDHNHSTTEVRGLLCVACNTGIGLLKDSTEILKRAIGYIENGC